MSYIKKVKPVSLFLSSLFVFLAYTPGLASNEFDAFVSQQVLGVEAEKQEFKQYQRTLEAGFDAYQKAYQQEFEIYTNEITQQWGEFLDPGPKTWVSYAQNNQVRRVADFEQGHAEVSLLLREGDTADDIDQQVRTAIYQWLNSTEADVYQADQLSRRIEQRLLENPSIVKTAQPSTQRIFALEDLSAMYFDQSSYIKVSKQNSAPVQWEITKTMNGEKAMVTASFVIPHSVHKKAKRFSDEVTAAAVRERLPPELILAVIETESSFNPMARSHIPAYGLMQIVPRSAGKDASRYLYGESKLLAPSYLYKVDKNIGVGSAYLHLLYYRYMRKVTDPVSRLYCVIAAYNTGASNVGAAFTGRKSFSGAVETINSMTQEEVYQVLVNELAYEETQKYLIKVTSRMKKYVKDEQSGGI